MTDQELQDKLNKESEDFKLRGPSARDAMLFDRMAFLMIQLHELQKQVTPKPPSHLI